MAARGNPWHCLPWSSMVIHGHRWDCHDCPPHPIKKQRSPVATNGNANVADWNATVTHENTMVSHGTAMVAPSRVSSIASGDHGTPMAGPWVAMTLPWVATGDHSSPTALPWTTMAVPCAVMKWQWTTMAVRRLTVALPSMTIDDYGRSWQSHAWGTRQIRGRTWHCHRSPRAAKSNHGSAIG